MKNPIFIFIIILLTSSIALADYCKDYSPEINVSFDAWEGVFPNLKKSEYQYPEIKEESHLFINRLSVKNDRNCTLKSEWLRFVLVNKDINKSYEYMEIVVPELKFTEQYSISNTWKDKPNYWTYIDNLNKTDKFNFPRLTTVGEYEINLLDEKGNLLDFIVVYNDHYLGYHTFEVKDKIALDVKSFTITMKNLTIITVLLTIIIMVIQLRKIPVKNQFIFSLKTINLPERKLKIINFFLREKKEEDDIRP